MRIALVSLIAAGAAAISVPALAQDAPPAPEATPAPAAEAPPAPAATDPAAVPAPAAPAVSEPTVVPAPAAPETVAVPVPAPAAPAVSEPPAPPAAPATTAQPYWPTPPAGTPAMPTQPYWPTPPPQAPEPPPPPPPPPPPEPTDPMAIAVLNAVERICKPLVHGGDIKALATPFGYRGKKDIYTVMVSAKPYQIAILPQGTNKNVCSLEIDYPIGQIEPIVVGVHNWAMARSWTLYRNDVFTTDMQRHTRSWEHAGETEIEALVLVAVRKPDGKPVLKGADRATVLYSVTPAPPPPPAQ